MAKKPRKIHRRASLRHKRNPNPNLLVRIFSGGVGVSHVKGWGRKGSVCPSKPRKPNFFGGICQDFAGISWRCPKSLRKKKFVFNFRSLFCRRAGTRKSFRRPLPSRVFRAVANSGKGRRLAQRSCLSPCYRSSQNITPETLFFRIN